LPSKADLNQSLEWSETFKKVKDLSDKESAELFDTKILSTLVTCSPEWTLIPDEQLFFPSRFPPVFHDWFIETFPEPSAWLASRLTYGRTAAVMSMVGYILGFDSLLNKHLQHLT
jgi:serine/threonine-protein kinase ATR